MIQPLIRKLHKLPDFWGQNVFLIKGDKVIPPIGKQSLLNPSHCCSCSHLAATVLINWKETRQAPYASAPTGSWKMYLSPVRGQKLDPVATETNVEYGVSVFSLMQIKHISKYLINSICQALIFPNIRTFISGLLIMLVTTLSFPA